MLSSISGRESASAALKVEELEVSQSGQTRVESQGFVVRQLFHLPELNLRLIKNARTWIGQRCRVTYHAYICGEVPFARPEVKRSRHCHHRRLAITPSRCPGPYLLFYPCAVRVDVLPVSINFQTVHSLIRYSPFKTPSCGSPSPNLCGTAYPARVTRM